VTPGETGRPADPDPDPESGPDPDSGPSPGPDPDSDPGPGFYGAGAGAVAGAAALIAALTVAARLTGFGRVFVFSGSVGGGGCTGTAYTTANLLPNVLFEVVAGGALAGAVVPVLSGLLAHGRREDADRVTSALLGWALLLLAPLSLLLALLSRPLMVLLLDPGPGCPGQADLAARMLIVFAPQIVLYGVGIVLAGTLQARHRFAGPALAPLLSSLVVIASYLGYAGLAGGRQDEPGWVPSPAGELVLSGGTTLGVAALSLPLLWPAARGGVRLRLRLRFPPGTARAVAALATAGIAALLAQQVAVLATMALANRVGGAGALNVFQFAQTIYLLPYGVLAVPLATAAFPRLSAQAARGEQAAFAATAAGTTRVVLLTAGAGAALIAGTAPAAEALFARLDAVGGDAFGALGPALVAFAPGLLGWSLVAHLSRVLYATGHGRAAAVGTATGWATATALSLAAVGTGAAAAAAAGTDPAAVAVIGLAAANSTGMLLAGGLLLGAVRRHRGAAAVSGTGTALAAAAAAAIPAALAGRAVAVGLSGGSGERGTLVAALLGGAGSALAVTVVFGLFAALLDRRDLLALVGTIRRRRAVAAGKG
jgi:putative peptidoglycan lipid II flippase